MLVHLLTKCGYRFWKIGNSHHHIWKSFHASLASYFALWDKKYISYTSTANYISQPLLPASSQLNSAHRRDWPDMRGQEGRRSQGIAHLLSLLHIAFPEQLPAVRLSLHVPASSYKGCEEESVHAFHSFWQLGYNLWHSLACRIITSISALIFTLCSHCLHVCVQIFRIYKDTSH